MTCLTQRSTSIPTHRSRVAPAWRRNVGVIALLAALCALSQPVLAQDAASSAPVLDASVGTLAGQVFDRESGDPVAGVTVILVWPTPADGSRAPQAVRVSDAEGRYAFGTVPADVYSLIYSKSGYRAAKMTRFEVEGGKANRADFPIQPAAAASAGAVLELEAFVVEAEVVEDIMSELELRMDSDQLLNVMSAEDLSRFAASDVADALKRISGVNVVEGQFAIIRGLEDRYNSTLYNGAPVPSPDPDRQSVQLDLFPSDVVSNLIVSKTFAPDLPSNSSGGSIDIVTHDYPEVFDLKISAGTGFEENAQDRFLAFSEGSPLGTDVGKDDVLESDFGGLIGGRRELLGRELRFKGVFNREIDYKTKQGFQHGREPVAPVIGAGSLVFIPGVGIVVLPGELEESGDLSLGELSLTDGRFDLTESTREKQLTGYGGLGLDLDRGGNHRVDGSFFRTEKEEQTVQLKDEGFLPGFDYDTVTDDQVVDDDYENSPGLAPRSGVVTRSSWIADSHRRGATNGPSDPGSLAFTLHRESRSFARDRDLEVIQLNGEHAFDRLPGLSVSWAANQAETSQDEAAIGVRFFYEPCGFGNQFVLACPNGVSRIDPPSVGSGPIPLAELGPGLFALNNRITLSSNAIQEDQDFIRLDGEYEIELFESRLRFELKTGGWYEHARRDVFSTFLENASVDPALCGASCLTGALNFAVLGETPEAMFDNFQRSVNLSGLRETTNESEREIWAWNVGGKATFFERVDLIGGLRLENIFIESLNDPFVPDDPATPAIDDSIRLGGPKLFPSRFVLFDRIDTNDEGLVGSTDPSELVFNDEILGIAVPVDENGVVNFSTRESLLPFVNGEIDERLYLPSAGFTVRPIEGLSLRGAWSQTVARPSFREMGYYVSVEPGSDDLVVGNPQLTLSDVESWDVRAEYAWGDFGDLIAVSGFKKSIDDPIESIVVRDPTNAELDSGSALYRTFFNNPNPGSLRGFEVEARKSFDFIPWAVDRLGFESGPFEFLSYLSVGGNYTYIDAEVGRTDAELERASGFFGVSASDTERFDGLAETRRLFGQPEWIANADVSFDHPDWGTSITLAWFAISDILDAAGTATIGPDGDVVSFTLDRYVDGFDQLDLVLRQTIRFDQLLPGEWSLPGEWTFKASIKNLTDSERGILYDPEQTTRDVYERRFQVGRDYSFSLGYKLSF